MIDLDDVKSRYEEAFDLFLAGEVEVASEMVTALGAETRDKGAGLETLVEMHTSCFARAAEKVDPLFAGKMLVDSSPLLVKGVMGYALTYCMSDMAGLVSSELQARRSELEEVRKRVREDDEFHNLFATPISHELRNPLNSIIGFCNILLNEWAGPLNPEQKEDLGLILKAGQNLLQLINELVDICRIESGVTRMTPGDVFLRDAIRDAAVKIGNGAIRTHLTGGPAIIVTDGGKLQQALENILGAVHELSADGLDLMLTADGYGRAVIGLSFRMENVPPDRAHLLFQPLFRPDGTHPMHGTGLSLYLSHLIVRDLLQGIIETSVEEDGEVRVKITLPASA